MNDIEMAVSSYNEKPYKTRRNHTSEFAKKSEAYARLYDEWETLTSDALRLQQEAERKLEEAKGVRVKLEAAANEVRGSMGGLG